MKIELLRDKLIKQYKPRPKKNLGTIINSEKTYFDVVNNKVSNTLENIMGSSSTLRDEEKVSNLKIIGITGSRGKSSVAYIVHEYLKGLGYKSVLYSSIKIDSPLSLCAENSAVENPLRDEQMLLDAIDQAITYQADYLIMEVNERAIKKGLSKDIPFDVRVITNIIPKHNSIFYSDYVEIKKTFFKEADSNTTLISALINKETIELKSELNSSKFISYSSEYISGVYKLNVNDVDFLLKPSDKQFESINGLNMIVKAKNNSYNLSTNLIMPYNALNITCCVAILETLNVYNHLKFQDFIKNIVIPGRDEVIKVANRTIMISTNLVPHLENLKRYKVNGEINKIILVTGATGLNFTSWVKEFQDKLYIQEKEFAIKFAYNYINNNCDVVYITTSDSGSANKEALVDYQAKLLDERVTCIKEIDRKVAIHKAIENSKENDVIFISGRGNRHIMCDSNDTVKIHLDKDVVEEILEEMKFDR